MSTRFPDNEQDALRALAQTVQGPVCLGHDWLTGMRGGERVLEYFCRAWPDAPIATLLGDTSLMSETIASHPVVFSPLNRLPGIVRHYRKLLPVLPWASRATRVPDCRLLLTTSHCVAKSFRKPEGARHLCVCFTPMRYAWTFYEEYFGTNPLKGAVVKPVLAALRAWDRQTAKGVDRFVAISQHVAKRIRDFYGREADVVYPPVDIVRCTPEPGALDPAHAVSTGGTGAYDLIVSALVPYKRVDLAVRVYSRLNRPLKVVGVGGCAEELRRLAGPSVEILGRRSDAEVLQLYRGCRALVFPGEEDYGIVPLEAEACGKPVLAYAKGGALETVRKDVCGVFFAEQTEDALEDAIARSLTTRFDARDIRRHAEAFGPVQFLEGMTRQIEQVLP